MAQTGKAPDKERAERALRMTLAGVIGQVGCLTLIIIGIALGAGFWLDSQFDTRPLFALVVVLASMPVTIFLMFRVVKTFMHRIQNSSDSPLSVEQEGPESGDKPANQT
jgi:hypothetical protein